MNDWKNTITPHNRQEVVNKFIQIVKESAPAQDESKLIALASSSENTIFERAVSRENYLVLIRDKMAWIRSRLVQQQESEMMNKIASRQQPQQQQSSNLIHQVQHVQQQNYGQPIQQPASINMSDDQKRLVIDKLRKLRPLYLQLEKIAPWIKDKDQLAILVKCKSLLLDQYSKISNGIFIISPSSLDNMISTLSQLAQSAKASEQKFKSSIESTTSIASSSALQESSLASSIGYNANHKNSNSPYNSLNVLSSNIGLQEKVNPPLLSKEHDPDVVTTSFPIENAWAQELLTYMENKGQNMDDSSSDDDSLDINDDYEYIFVRNNSDNDHFSNNTISLPPQNSLKKTYFDNLDMEINYYKNLGYSIEITFSDENLKIIMLNIEENVFVLKILDSRKIQQIQTLNSNVKLDDIKAETLSDFIKILV